MLLIEGEEDICLDFVRDITSEFDDRLNTANYVTPHEFQDTNADFRGGKTSRLCIQCYTQTLLLLGLVPSCTTSNFREKFSGACVWS